MSTLKVIAYVLAYAIGAVIVIVGSVMAVLAFIFWMAASQNAKDIQQRQGVIVPVHHVGSVILPKRKTF